MFRYVAWAWDPSLPLQSELAAELRRKFGSTPGWRPAIDQLGMQVWVTGTISGVNEIHPLGGNRGVVLGKVYRSGHPVPATQVRSRFSERDAEAIVRSGGRALIRDHWGRYVAFLRDDDDRWHLLRDPSGALPCYRMRCRGVELAFSWLPDVLTTPTPVAAPAVNENALTAHLLCGPSGGRLSSLQGVAQVLPGECVALGATSGATTGSSTMLWDLVDVAELEPIEDPAIAAEQLRAVSSACVQSWAASYGSVLLRLSGGVDSSIVAACLAAGRTDSHVTCVNYHSPGVDSDERQYARQAAARAHLPLVERERAEDFPLARILDAAITPSPVHHVSRMGSAHMDAELAAAAGAQALFTGTGGDQLFFEFHQAWAASDYLHLHGLGAGFWTTALDAARLGRTTLWGAVRLALADRLQPSVQPLQVPAPPHLFSDKALGLAQQILGPGDAFGLLHPAVQASRRLPLGKRRQVQYLLHPVPHHDAFGGESAPELVSPLMSQPLMELCLRLPTYVLTRGGRARGLARDAFAAELPADIARRRAKGGIAEHVQGALLHNLGFVQELLLDGELVRLGLIDRPRTESLLRGNRTALVNRAGEVHSCLATEAWLQRVRRAETRQVAP